MVGIANVGTGGALPIGAADPSLLGDLNGPNGDAAMRMLAQELNDQLTQDPKAAKRAMEQMQQLDPQLLALLLMLLDPDVREAIKGALGQGGGAAGGGRGGGGIGGYRPPGGYRGGGTGARGGAPSPGRSANAGTNRLPPVDGSQRTKTVGDTNVPKAKQYPPGSQEQRALFREAAKLAGVPESWADSPGLINILKRESNGQVGRPNYTYGARAKDPSQWDSIHEELKSGKITAKSSATGLGQLLLSNVDKYYPNGRAGIGDPLQEAAGMMRYIKDRYGDPENAWRLYGKLHEGY